MGPMKLIFQSSSRKKRSGDVPPDFPRGSSHSGRTSVIGSGPASAWVNASGLWAPRCAKIASAREGRNCPPSSRTARGIRRKYPSSSRGTSAKPETLSSAGSYKREGRKTTPPSAVGTAVSVRTRTTWPPGSPGRPTIAAASAWSSAASVGRRRSMSIPIACAPLLRRPRISPAR